MISKDKTVLITGAKGCIGKALIEAFASSGFNIIAQLRKEDDSFSQFIDDVTKKHGILVDFLYFDLTDISEMQARVKDLFIKQKKTVDVLINNAAVAHGGLFQMTPVKTIRDVFNVNLFAQMELTQMVIKIMMRNKKGCIINMGSVLGVDIKDGACAYGLSKSAFMEWTKILAYELAGYNIRVNAIAPSLVDSDMAKLMDVKCYESMIKSTALNRLAKPTEIANVALFLAEEKSSFVNGQIIRVDGGMR